jgi:DNA-binding response OmpR family regulator
MAKLLLVEDDRDFAQSLIYVLQQAGHVVEHSLSGTEGLDWALHMEFDVAIIDWQLPDLAGTEICKTLCEKKPILPLLMLTSMAETRDKIFGLNSGALDYVVKTCEADELIARVRALLRRSKGTSESSDDIIECGPLLFQKSSRTVTCYDKPIKLTKTDYMVLEFLARHPGQDFTATAILERLWKGDKKVGVHVVRVYISRLKEKLAECGAEDILTSVNGQYRLQNTPSVSDTSRNLK